MSYRKLNGFGDEDFRRLTGIRPATFRQMVKFLKAEEEKKLKEEAESLTRAWQSGCL
jgi:hypothetical protein